MIAVVSIQIPQLYSSLYITAGTYRMGGEAKPRVRCIVVS